MRDSRVYLIYINTSITEEEREQCNQLQLFAFELHHIRRDQLSPPFVNQFNDTYNSDNGPVAQRLLRRVQLVPEDAR